MNDQELADAVVGLGVGYNYHGAADHYGLSIDNPDFRALMAPFEFIRDWRVAGALMEKVKELDYHWRGWWSVSANKYGDGDNDCLPRAIVEACVLALQEEEK